MSKCNVHNVGNVGSSVINPALTCVPYPLQISVNSASKSNQELGLKIAILEKALSFRAAELFSTNSQTPQLEVSNSGISTSPRHLLINYVTLKHHVSLATQKLSDVQVFCVTIYIRRVFVSVWWFQVNQVPQI